MIPNTGYNGQYSGHSCNSCCRTRTTEISLALARLELSVRLVQMKFELGGLGSSGTCRVFRMYSFRVQREFEMHSRNGFVPHTVLPRLSGDQRMQSIRFFLMAPTSCKPAETVIKPGRRYFGIIKVQGWQILTGEMLQG